MQKHSNKNIAGEAPDYARQHYQRLHAMRFHLDLCLLAWQHSRVGLRLIQRTRHNQHTKGELKRYLGNPAGHGEVYALRDAVTELHGRLCVPHPMEPQRFQLVAWVSYDEAVAVTGRARRTLYRWRWNGGADRAAWRLLEWSAHGVCALEQDLLYRAL
jgi:hypothetical protein